MRNTAVQSLTATVRPLQLLLVAVIVLPIGFFVAASWLDYRWTLEEAEQGLARTTDAVHEHALRVFDTNALILDRIAERYGDLDWDVIAASPSARAYLKRLVAAAPQIAVLGFIAPDLRIPVTNLDLPPGEALRHDFMPIHRAGGDLYISELGLGNYTHNQHFLVTRDMPGRPHQANGSMIFASIRPDYFKRYYGEGFGHDYAISLVRADGAILARYPDLPGEPVLGPDTGFRRSIARDPMSGSYSTESALDGRSRLFRYRKLGDYPVYVAVGMNYSTILGTTAQKIAWPLLFALPATLALIAITIVALRRSRAAQAALNQANEETQRRQALETSLHHAQKMEAVGQLTGGIAHDFNNLLTAIMGSLEMIQHVADGASTIAKYAGGAMRAAERGARLTQQLLAFSRRQILNPEIVNVNRLLGEFETLMQRAVGESIDFVLTLDPEVDPCRIDPAHFEAAVLNLLMNARDATSAGGRIAIETRNVLLASDSPKLDPEVVPGRYVMVMVSDTGAGMSPEVRAQAFDPFFTTKEVGKGSGLGLSQVYGFAKQSGGHVTVDSEPGQGTTVRLYLPSMDAPAAQRVELAPAARPQRATSASVLVVEDDVAVLETVRAALTALGYRAVTALNANEALDILRRDEPIDLLLTDIVMPGGINGIELARRARQLRQDIRVLLTSGYAAALAEGRAGNAFAVLGKPYRQAQLAEKVAAVLERRA